MKKYILKEAGVLTIGIFLIFSSIAVMGTSTEMNTTVTQKYEITYLQKNILPCNLQDDVILWDNFVLTWKTAYHSQDDPPEEPKQWDSFVADDFMFEEETEVKWIYWQIYYGFSVPKDYHYDWNVTFFEDDGTGNNPGAIYRGPITLADADIDKSLPYLNESQWWICGATAFFPEPVTFDADTKYWISIYSIGPIYPQTFLTVHNETQGGILLHEGKFKSDRWGYPDWTNFTEVYGEPLDANFILGRNPPFEVTLKKGLGVTAKITNNLPEGEEGLVHNLTVNFTATGGFVLNPIKNVLITEFEGQTTETVKWLLIGFGSITIDVYCTSLDVGIGSADTKGLLLFFFLI